MKRLVLSTALIVAVGACKPEIPNTPSGAFVTARFDPSNAPPVLPTPNDLATNAATGLLAVPIPVAASGADKAFYEWLNTLNGFPAAASATATFTGALNGTTVNATTVRVLDLSASNAAVSTTISSAETADLSAPGVVTVSAPTGGWTPGHRYAVAVIGGADGVKGKEGTPVVASPTWAFIRSEKPLVTCDDLKTDCAPTTEIIPSDIKDDPSRRLAAQTASALQLEQLRRKYAPAISSLTGQGIARTDIALLWEFKINDSPNVLFDPSRSRLPTPNDLAISNGVVMAPIDANSSPANQEFTRDYVNTLNGFPPSLSATAAIVGETLDPATVTAQTVRVTVVKGETLSAPPVISYNPAVKQLSIAPAGGSWGVGRTLSIALIGGAKGLKSASGKRVVSSDAWALVRSASPLVDCETLGTTCKSVVTAAPITNEQAIGLEGLRRRYEPLLDSLEDEGFARADVAALWVFSTVDQPELIFDPVAMPPRIPVPTNLAIADGKVAAPVPANASPAYAEFITEYLNTLNGFPVSATATASLAGDIDGATIGERTVKVAALQGTLSSAPTIAWDAVGHQLTVTPAEGSWGKGRTIAIAVLGGSSGVKDVRGKALAASQVWAFARLENTLVDCETLSSSCKSVVAVSDSQAVALEGLRRSLKPAVDAFVGQGISRKDLAGVWVFSTVNQPELTFELSPTVIVPFPTNQFLRAFVSSHIQTRPDGGVVGDDVDPTMTLTFPSAVGTVTAAGLNTLNGFSVTAPLVSENSETRAALDVGLIDPLTVHDGGSVGFAKISGGGSLSPSVRVCLDCASSDAGSPQQLQWVPQLPLAELARYGAWVTTDVKDTQGVNVMASPAFALVRSRHPLIDENDVSTVPVVSSEQALKLEVVRQRFKDCLDQLEAKGTPRSKLSLGFCVTTQSTVEGSRKLVADVEASPFSSSPTLFVDSTATLRPALILQAIPQANVGAYLEGDLVLPQAFTGTGGTLHPNAATWQSRKARFLLTVPATAAPSAGYPVAMFAHGLGRSRRDVLLLADALAGAGIATIAIDAVFHGDRSSCIGAGALINQPDDAVCADSVTMRCETSPGATQGRCVSRTSSGAACDPATTGDAVCFGLGQGRCTAANQCEGGSFKTQGPVEQVLVSGSGFVNLSNLFATRDHFLHGAVDFAQLIRVISSTSAGTSLNARLSAATLGTLDSAKISFVGNSLGTFSGSMISAASPRVNRFLLNVAGADHVDVLLSAPSFAATRATFLASLASQGIHPGTPAFDSFVTLARTIFDSADSQNLLFAGVNSSNVNRQVFVQYIERDDVFPNTGTQRLLAAARQNSARQPSWYEFLERPTAAVGVIPSSMVVSERHGFTLRPPPSSPECNPLATTCATVTAQVQLVQFISQGVTPMNTPVSP